MNFSLITTTIYGSPGYAKIGRLLDSVERARNDGHVIRHYLLIQGISVERGDKINIFSDENIIVNCISEVVSLSAARNYLLPKVTSIAEDEHIIAFPDDDAWFPEGALGLISSEIRSNHADFAFCRYGSEAAVGGTVRVVGARLNDAVRNGSSNTIFIKNSIVKRVGGFDEDLGVGARYNGGEDVDYAIRSYFEANSSIYIDAQLVGHRDKFSGMQSKYFIGNAKALQKSALLGYEYFFQYVRKILIGVFLFFRREISISTLFKSIM